MGAPAKPRKRAAAKPKGPAQPRVDDLPELSEEELARLTQEAEEAGASLFGPDGEVIPVEIGKAGKAGPELLHIFTLGTGTPEEEKFYIPKRPSPAVMLKFMRDARNPRIGRWGAIENAMVMLLGRDAMDGLAECRDASEEDVAKVWALVLHVLLQAVNRWKEAVEKNAGPS